MESFSVSFSLLVIIHLYFQYIQCVHRHNNNTQYDSSGITQYDSTGYIGICVNYIEKGNFLVKQKLAKIISRVGKERNTQKGRKQNWQLHQKPPKTRACVAKKQTFWEQLATIIGAYHRDALLKLIFSINKASKISRDTKLRKKTKPLLVVIKSRRMTKDGHALLTVSPSLFYMFLTAV